MSSLRPWWSLRRPAGAMFWLAAVLFTAGVLVPLVHANRFRHRLQSALEAALGRRVEIGDVTLTLLTGPGFRLENVVISEDPAFGLEPFAHMTAMQARLRLRTLWTGEVQLASLTLEQPSINLVKNAAGQWNFETLMARAGAPARPAGPAMWAPAEAAYFPYIGIDAGRANFKFGDYKSLFHLQEVEAAISPPRDAGGRWFLRFGCRPSRADERLLGMGRLTGQGSLTGPPSEGGDRSMHLEVALETSPAEYLLRLVRGTDYGIHGDLAARVRLSGRLADIGVQGTVEIGDVHRWDLTPAQPSRLSVPLAGRLDLSGQSLHLETGPTPAAPVPVHVTLDLDDFLGAPRWRGAVDFSAAPAAPFLRMAQHFGARWPEGLELRGQLDGRLEFPGAILPTGQLTLTAGELSWSGAPPLRVASATLQVTGNDFQVPAAALRMGQESLEAAIAGRLSPAFVQAQLTGRGVRLATARPYVETAHPGGLGGLLDGRWEGRVIYRKEAGSPGVWSGQGLLTDAQWQPEGLATPIRLAQARLRWEPGQFRAEPLAGSLGETEFSGSCSRRSAPGPAEPGHSACQLRIPDLDLAQLADSFQAGERPGRWVALKRALGRRDREPPAWLASLAADGALRVDHLRAGPWEFRNLRSRAAWTGGILTLSALRAELGTGTVTGGLQADFTGEEPRYSLQAAARGVDLAGLSETTVLPAQVLRGSLDAKLGLEAQGRTTQELRSALKLNGVFDAQAVSLEGMRSEDPEAAAGWEIRQLTGGFTWTRAGLEMTRLRLTLGRDVYQGRGALWGPSPVLFDVASGDRKLRLVAAEVAEPAAEAP